VVVNSKNTYKNLAQLSMWGVIYDEANGSGFAMEFIGDMQDSTVGGSVAVLTPGGRSSASNSTTHTMPGRGIN
jgi:hypothetical protein